MKSSKRDHDCTSSSEEDVTYKKQKTFYKKHSKRRNSTSSSSSVSSSSTTSCDSRFTEDHKSRKHKQTKESKLKYKNKSKKNKKAKKKKKSNKGKESSKSNILIGKKEHLSTSKEANLENEASNDIPLHLMDKSMVPMTKAQWEKQQSIVRKVYDESTGRYRLIKGDGEVIEEIVSRERHKQINQQATRGDGEYFQSNLMQLNIRK